ncbi:uncharacterized protein CCOS01_12160 [Colletotrichum costaricense]|uniref:Uncharacterized protein n=1 Tax=Colletotrichum costaricense TaxID=1209916 RepID=A0AAI9YNP1_9PEZI|nr:uncharacterized protein CCOS01_12160 [Colletotrichum costaricense]KAK1517903.1 hypothetical protein CCOS01_12160 [Colletotrichum costaricense]
MRLLQAIVRSSLFAPNGRSHPFTPPPFHQLKTDFTVAPAVNYAPTPPPVTIASLEMSGELAYRPTQLSPVQGVSYYRAPPNTSAVHWTCEYVLFHIATGCLAYQHSGSGASNYIRRRLAYCVIRFLHLNRDASILIRQKTPDHDLHPHVGHRVGKATSQQRQKRKRLAALDRAPTPMISRILPVSSSLQLGFTVQATRHTKLATRTWCSQATTPPEAYTAYPVDKQAINGDDTIHKTTAFLGDLEMASQWPASVTCTEGQNVRAAGITSPAMTNQRGRPWAEDVGSAGISWALTRVRQGGIGSSQGFTSISAIATGQSSRPLCLKFSTLSAKPRAVPRFPPPIGPVRDPGPGPGFCLVRFVSGLQSILFRKASGYTTPNPDQAMHRDDD